jgi:hypothetical protein
MYRDDSFFTLSGGAQIGLALVSFLLVWVALQLVFSLTRGRPLWLRFILAALLFVAFVWLSPQVYYAYYRALIEGLPAQWVISAPNWDPLHYLSFTGPRNLSAHGQGLLGWAMLALAVLRR